MTQQQQQFQQHFQMQQMQFQQQQQLLRQQQLQQQSMQQQPQQAQQQDFQAQFYQQQGQYQMQQPWQWGNQKGGKSGQKGQELPGAASGQFGGDSPRTAAWKAQMAKAATPKIDTDDWIAKRNQALAAGPAHRAKPGGNNAPSQPKDADAREVNCVDFGALGKVFADERPWADIDDEDKTAEELKKIIQLGEERKKIKTASRRKWCFGIYCHSSHRAAC